MNRTQFNNEWDEDVVSNYAYAIACLWNFAGRDQIQEFDYVAGDVDCNHDWNKKIHGQNVTYRM